MSHKQLVILFVIAGVILAYFFGGGEKLLAPSLYRDLFEQHPVATPLVFFSTYVLGTALSLPVSGVLSVIAGMIFSYLGIPLALFACTIGGTFGYLLSRYLLHRMVQQRFADRLIVINKGIEEEGAFYLFCLRMVPIVPFWLLNLLMGVSPLGVGRFFAATLLGMLPVTVILVHFGTQLGAVESFSMGEIFTPGLIVSLMLLAAIPFLTRALVNLIRKQKADNSKAVEN